MVHKFFNKNSASLTGKFTKGGGVNNKIRQNEQFAEEFHKPMIEKF